MGKSTKSGDTPAVRPFKALGLDATILSALTELGYEMPTPVQNQSIPILLEGRDLIAQAQTGTGKTAAFALPVLSQIDLKDSNTQALVIAPTRELAMQVAEAFKGYAKKMKGFQVTSIYGGQDYTIQLRALKKQPQVVVGTPGRLMDHMRRGTLSIKHLKTLVLDEADEMLKMGFIDDIEWILEQIPGEHQTALFSATMPKPIQKIAKRYLTAPEKILVEAKHNTVSGIEQFYTVVPSRKKFDVLTRFLEVEETQATIIFTRTKTTSGELAEKLQARGYGAAALNGDMAQASRKKVIDRIKAGTLDIVVATDVAARGIDIERMSHVFNYDAPMDEETYTHRIGRTGRAGRKGKAFLFVGPRETRLLRSIEKSTQKPMQELQAPSITQINEMRNKALAEKVVGVLAKTKNLQGYRSLVEGWVDTQECSPVDIAAALVYLMQQKNTVSDSEPTPDRDERSRSRKPAPRSRSAGGRSGGYGKSESGRSGSGSGRSGQSNGSRKPAGSRSDSQGKKKWVTKGAKPKPAARKKRK